MAKAKCRIETFLINDREASSWLTLSAILDRLGWTHYSDGATGEEIDAGDDSEAARTEVVEVPLNDTDMWDYLDAAGVFDYA